ncbi:aminodeoxychorismate synthase, subunit I [Rubrobacter xylanophilus DSM 9941]|uniref:aminodeoxychorismate synthase n=1 Tax=Rubrobacter xylanophilus (strain DSM 9941 / JCM 11954 / NBRC 16129 / PRD-1) TaxID=266117 RepID=Q1AXZ9_RUBXD|nr:aminodeoxychorismate synthase component I [Rubrobacter xylanophilus]ABG03729.1 aminodeoxychorismate synthase, subunit I [Rubrobacter xylanophilus DSM 9941]
MGGVLRSRGVAPLVVPVGLSPVEAMPRVLGLRRPVLLDGGMPGGWDEGRSYLAAEPFLVVRSRGRWVEVEGPEGRRAMEADPFAVLSGLLARYRVERRPGLPPLAGGAIGYFGYDLGRLLERLPELNADDAPLPEMEVGFYDWVLAFEGGAGRGCIVSTGLPQGTEEAARGRLEEVVALLEGRAGSLRGGAEATPPLRFRSDTGRGTYEGAVERAREYIRAGDVFQVNLSHRLRAEAPRPVEGWGVGAWPLYRRLRERSPVPHGAYLGLGEAAVLSASPERFLRLAGRGVQTRPIKGTRPRGRNPEEDRRMARLLASSAKDRAENVMIVDLLRNDIGKVCRTGSVRVPELCGLEGHASVWHLVSTVVGELRPGAGVVELLAACFPGGSVTGAPKIRAMEIIEELEPVRRGVYCGAIGYISFCGEMDTNIAIRTLVLAGNEAHLQVGGAVVADSDPRAEYDETLAKARAVVEGLGARLEER